jgi:hypothetical protein
MSKGLFREEQEAGGYYMKSGCRDREREREREAKGVE